MVSRPDDIAQRVVRLETQMGRSVSDAESEKETRRRFAADLDKRLQRIEDRLKSIESKQYYFAGAIAAFVFVIHYAMGGK